MGWFENQIQDRREADQQLLEESFLRIAGVVMGEKDAQRIGDARCRQCDTKLSVIET